MEYFDHVLSAEEKIVPSSGFTRAVMEAVHREASAPMPIPFPWKRVLPAMLLVAVVVLVLVFVPATMPGEIELPTMQLAAMLTSLLETIGRFYVNWLLGSLLLSWACVNLSMRLASLRS